MTKKHYFVRAVESREYTEICYMSVLLNKDHQNNTILRYQFCSILDMFEYA